MLFRSLALAALRLEPVEGRVVFLGQNITHLSRRALRHLRAQMQIVFQDPFGSLSPRMTIGDIKFRTLGDTIAMMEGIRNDQIDGALWTVGGLSQIIADKSGVRWVNMAAGEVPEVNPLPYVVTMGLTSWIAKNPQTVTRLRAAMSEAVELINKEPAKYSAAIKTKYFPSLDQAIWDESFKLVMPSFFKGATAPRAGWDYMLKMQAATTKKDYTKAAYERALIPEAQVR